jgi:hypothetical protein
MTSPLPRESLAHLLCVERHGAATFTARLGNFWGGPLDADVWARATAPTTTTSRRPPRCRIRTPYRPRSPRRAEGWPGAYACGPVEFRRIGPRWPDSSRGA